MVWDIYIMVYLCSNIGDGYVWDIYIMVYLCSNVI